jgi:hypothetical protein
VVQLPRFSASFLTRGRIGKITEFGAVAPEFAQPGNLDERASGPSGFDPIPIRAFAAEQTGQAQKPQEPPVIKTVVTIDISCGGLIGGSLRRNRHHRSCQGNTRHNRTGPNELCKVCHNIPPLYAPLREASEEHAWNRELTQQYRAPDGSTRLYPRMWQLSHSTGERQLTGLVTPATLPHACHLPWVSRGTPFRRGASTIPRGFFTEGAAGRDCTAERWRASSRLGPVASQRQPPAGLVSFGFRR